ncbi:ABC transporter substrate-binding protein [Alkalihalobacillus pseudalcaliphilus]|nr:ABC transporter substrate-binding protein [Alkalihalobacillus pseudalcaliphilus]
MKHIKGFIFIGLILILLNACQTAEEGQQSIAEEDDILTVYTTIFPLQDFAQKIGGEFVEVHNMIPAGADAHTYDPSAKDMIDVAEGDVFLYNGSGLEGFVDSLIETLKNEEVAIVEASANIELMEGSHSHQHHEHEGHEEDEHEHHEHGGHEEDEHEHHDHGGHEEDEHEHHEHEGHEEDEHEHHEHEGHEEDEHEHHEHEEGGHEHHHHGDEDPHVWLDPLLSIELAENIKNAFVDVKPEQADLFESNFEQLKEELNTLHQEFEKMAKEAEKNTFIVSHAGYGYWEQRYGLHQVGITGLTGTNEPSHKQIQDIIQLVEENDINYIMFEQNIPSKISEVVQVETNTDALTLHNLEVLTQEDINNKEDYFSLMQQNIQVLEQALN